MPPSPANRVVDGIVQRLKSALGSQLKPPPDTRLDFKQRDLELEVFRHTLFQGSCLSRSDSHGSRRQGLVR
jgi:hypothetical protein